jgi:hypothetical protein
VSVRLSHESGCYAFLLLGFVCQDLQELIPLHQKGFPDQHFLQYWQHYVSFFQNLLDQQVFILKNLYQQQKL